MTNVIYGYFEAAGSLHRYIDSFSKDEEGFYDNTRLIRLYAGAVAECLLDYEDWKEGLDEYFGFSKDLKDSLDTTLWRENEYATQAFLIDKDTELGRSLVRTYLDDTPETSFMMLRNIRSSLRALIDEDHAFWSYLYDVTLVTLVSEQFVHIFCDQIVDICIGAERWSMGDAIQALATLSGQYHARTIDTYDLGRSKQAKAQHDFDYMINTMINEAMRLGMPDHAGMYTMLAANDTQPYIPYHKSNALELIADPVFRVFHVMDSDLRSMMIAKATGRMMAVAAAGDDPDMDSCVVTPLALSCMQGSYISSLNA